MKLHSLKFRKGRGPGGLGEFLDRSRLFPCDQMESGWTIPDRSGEKVMANSHQTSLLWEKYFGLTRLVWLEGDGQ